LDILAYGHILSAMGWLGGGILNAFVIGPSLRSVTSSASLEFNVKVLPQIIRFVQVMIGTTFIFGILLYYFDFSGSFSTLSSTMQGMELDFGIVLALVTAVIVWSVTIPSFKKISKIANDLLKGGQHTPPPEFAKYGKRAMIGSLVGIVLLLVVLAMMVAAGFVPY